MKQIEQTLTTLEIAEMMESEHYKVLEKLEGTKDKKTKGVIPTMTAHEIVVSDYFTESTYKDVSGKENKCYKVTRIGCDFLANKFTGEKGILFTARYVKKFHDMEDAILNLDGVSPELQAIILQDKKLQVVEHRVEHLENNMTIDCGQQNTLANKVNVSVIKALGGKSSNAYKEISKVVFSECNRDFKNYFNINSRNNTPKVKFNEAIDYIETWEPCSNTKLNIRNWNAQINLGEVG